MNNSKRNYWTDAQIEILKNKYSDLSTETLAAELNHSLKSVYYKANKLGIKKSEAFLKSDLSGRLSNLSKSGIDFRFKPGHISHNKGKKGMVAAGCEKGWFKKGNLSHNAKEDGYIRTSVDGYKEIRVSKGKFKLLHRVIWEQAYGPIPDGNIITFKDGNPANTEIENLMMITRKENVIRNSIHKLPEDLKETIRVLAKLKRRIKNHEEQNDGCEKSSDQNYGTAV